MLEATAALDGTPTWKEREASSVHGEEDPLPFWRVGDVDLDDAGSVLPGASSCPKSATWDLHPSVVGWPLSRSVTLSLFGLLSDAKMAVVRPGFFGPRAFSAKVFRP